MRVDQSDQAHRALAEEQSSETSDPADEGNTFDPNQHWSCGSSTKWTTSWVIEDEMKRDWQYDKFDAKVRKFLTHKVSERFGDTIMDKSPGDLINQVTHRLESGIWINQAPSGGVWAD
jgi:hypothetical protein